MIIFKKILNKLISLKIFQLLPDKYFLKVKYYFQMGQKLNLRNPNSFNEKLQWLKLNDRKPEYTNLVDKFEVREIVSKKIGKKYLIPLIGLWDNFDDIIFSELPNKFVLKTTHDSGGVVICTDKDNFDIKAARKKINKSLSSNYYFRSREWPYKNVNPKIIIEKNIETKDKKLPMDYKLFCFHGKVDSIMVCTERETGKPKYLFVNEKLEVLSYNKSSLYLPDDYTIKKIERMNEMIKIAEQLSSDFKFVRVDLYCEEDRIFFGELTFYPQSGFDDNILPEADLYMGKLLHVPFE